MKSRLLLALGLAALGAVFLAASYTARPVHGATCVLVVGYSNTTQWFTDGGFESKSGIVNGEWESIAEGGSHIVRLAYESSYNWDSWASNNITSDCTSNPRAPTVVLLDVGFRYQADIDNGVQIITDAVARTRSVLGFSGTIYLKPMVGSVGTCSNWSSIAAPQSRDKVNAVVALDPSLRAVPYMTIPCAEFRSDGSEAHFSTTGSVNVANQMAAWYGSLGSSPTPTPTPAPTPTLVSCERVATYSDGFKVSVALPLGDC